MSVKKNLRTDSKIEYLNRFQQLYKHTIDKACGISKRRFEDVGAPLVEAMNKAQEKVMKIFLTRFDREITEVERKKMVDDAISVLLNSRHDFLAYFNIQRLPFKKECYWAELFNQTICYLGKVVGYDMENEIFLPVLDYEACKNAKFVHNMQKFHRRLYQNIISSPRKVHQTNGKVLIELADYALYHISEGNRRIPETAEEYEKRRNHFSDAVDCLKMMDPALVALFNLERCSEETIIELSKQLSDELKMLRAVIESDKKRFGKLA